MRDKDNYLKFTIDIKKLKGLGYTFQKLYARNYKTYRKDIGKGGRTIWLWVLERRIEIDDWFSDTGAILEFYKKNRNHPEFDRLNKAGEKWNYYKIRLCNSTGEIIEYDNKEYYQELSSKDDKSIEKYFEKYKDYREIVFYKPTMEFLLKEIEVLTNNQN